MAEIYFSDSITEKEIEKIAASLRLGAVAVLPTETVYGIFFRYDLPKLAERVYEVKQRPIEKVFSLTLASTDDVTQYFLLEKWQLDTVKELLPGPITFVLKPAVSLENYLVSSEGKTGLRIPDQPLVQKIIERVGYPLASTSANLSGNPSPADFNSVSVKILEKVDFALNAGKCRLKTPSTVYDLSFYPGKIIRIGAVDPEVIRKTAERFFKK